MCRLVEGLSGVLREFNARGECDPRDQLADQAGEVGHSHEEGICDLSLHRCWNALAHDILGHQQGLATGVGDKITATRLRKAIATNVSHKVHFNNEVKTTFQDFSNS